MSELIKVGMADLKVCKFPDILTTLGLGSCVGVALRDPVAKVGGMIHIMLPDSKAIRGNGNNPAKFADTGMQEMIREMEHMGARLSRMEAKMAGGATMFQYQSKSELTKIGERNAEACRGILKELGIPLLAEDVGKNYGRTIVFETETGRLLIRAVGKQEFWI